MLRGIMQYQRAHGPWQITLHDDARAEIDSCWVRGRKWAGVISHNTTPALVKTCARLHLPLIDLDDMPLVPGVIKIRPDNAAVGHLAAEYFIERKFRHFGFCGYANFGWSTERRDGFQEALKLAGQRCDLFDVEQPAEVTPSWEAKQIALLAAWLRYLPAETAVMACNDVRAQQVVRAAQEAGLRVPEDIAVLGVNNDVMRCELIDPSISSVALHAEESGRRAAEELDRLMKGGQPEKMDIRIEPADIVTRK
jgi:LacI family transcriptional regulator